MNEPRNGAVRVIVATSDRATAPVSEAFPGGARIARRLRARSDCAVHRAELDIVISAMTVRFTLNGEPIAIDEVEPHVTLLQWLRASGRTGTKEGCAEGECGACAVAFVTNDAQGRARFESVNSCLVSLGTVAGRTVVSVEGIARGGALHPVQEAMVRLGGSQCGYCTPGFVVSLFCEYYRPGRAAYDPESIVGNLCRCTGYRPIADAARALPPPSAGDPWLETLRAPAPAPAAVDRAGSRGLVRPTSLARVFELLRECPGAALLAGGTDLMVYANQRYQRWPMLIALDAIEELARFEMREDEIVLGAGVPLSRIEERLADEHPGEVGALEALLPLFSSRLIRNRATLGGNLATGSPIGDSLPALLALDAHVAIASARGERRVALSDFFLGYRKTALEPGEVLVRVHLPRPLPKWQRFYKVSKRVLDDISTVAGAFALDVGPDGVERLRVAYGGIAATPVRATAVEKLAQGRPWTKETLAVLLDGLEGLGTPQSDARGSAAYRSAMTGKLLERFFVETTAAMEKP
jgi:xanthine dehydrogenase small subunit